MAFANLVTKMLSFEVGFGVGFFCCCCWLFFLFAFVCCLCLFCFVSFLFALFWFLWFWVLDGWLVVFLITTESSDFCKVIVTFLIAVT